MKVHLLNVPGPQDPMELDVLFGLLAPSIEVSTGAELPDPADFHILVAGYPTRDHLAASPNLQAVIVPFAGPPESTRKLMADFPHVAVHNLHHNTVPTAEMAVALLFAAARFIVPADRRLREGDWTLRHEPAPTMILHGKTALILGYGAVGQHVGRVCQALGMRLLAVRRNPQVNGPPDIAAEVHGPDRLRELLPQADALIITLPLTEETRGLIGADELALLPDGALLVNVGRGPVVDEAALYQGLASGKPAAAGLDVWYVYPETAEDRTHTMPSRLPFHALDNVVMSPHTGGAFGTAYTEHERMVHLATLLNAAAAGQPMPNRIDLVAGY